MAPRRWAVISLTVMVTAEGIPYLAGLRLRESQTSAAAGNLKSALEDAAAARELEPWATSPYVQEALVEEEQGDLSDARRSIGQAIDHDRTDWTLWLIHTRLETEAGAIASARRSLDRMRSLNPRSPIVTSLPR
jgi:tetratricopeptide (TPR) repeat protein